MNIKPLHHTWKLIGIPALAAGITLGAVPAAAGAQETADTDLTKGDSGSEVKELQTLLEDRGLLQSSDVNGTYDENTASAIKDYQNKFDLSEDGIAGPVTVGSLEILSQGDEGEAVEYLQESLSNLGHYEGEADGVFSEDLHQAVIDFQRSQNILVDGLAGPQTFGTINAEINEAERAEQRQAEQEQEAAETSKNHNESVAAESSSSEQEGRTINVSATAYTADCAGCSGVTATGVNLNANPSAKVIAVDPDVIPLGSKVHIEGYGTYTAADTGGSIHGNKIDVHMPSKSAAYDFGRRNLEVTILN
ncbi:peptidoglycan-binding protein [Salibacterium halotolerans]|uniref:3D (Asp-Asp-Asp) domain-containing protein n=1 Tax=Salibacterium halotolerans TaxID=1884432 RepID=A0A1I5RKD7_9BACI|nr:peptidoglycan-binding protein [Salibacterium halotolerans]SFP58731.1 3D (Asp-Asp-Asp) domain-containing protein [Salibacterium halotolerans]